MKKLVTLMLSAAILATTGIAAFAEPEATPAPSDEPVVINDLGDSKRFTDTTVKVTSVNENEINYTDGETGAGFDASEAVIFDLNGDVKTVSDIKADDSLVLYTDANTGNVKYIVISDEEGGTILYIDLFAKSETLGDYVDTVNYLAVNVSDETNITDLDGNKLTGADIENKYIAVFYDMTTMSIPAITNPKKIVVLEDGNVDVTIIGGADAPTNILVTDVRNVIFVTTSDVIKVESVKLIPVRKYAEGLDLEVKWNGEDKSVTVGTIPMGVGFKIGENSYSKSKMTPFVLETAPQLINDTTYVPISFFEQVLETKVDIVEFQVVINE